MKIVFLEPIGMAVKQIEQMCASVLTDTDNLVIFSDRVEDTKILIERAEGADIVVVSNIPLGKDFFDALPTLKMVSVAFAGIDHIDTAAAAAHNVVVKNAAGYSTTAVAELAIALMIERLRDITPLDRVTRHGGTRGSFLGGELRGRCVGIVGLGAIGQETARLVQAFGCRVIAYNRSTKMLDGIEQCSLNELCKQADIISLHLPLTAETRGLLGKEQIELMKPTAIVVNTARGAVLDIDALVDAVANKRIAGAALDVYTQEPPLPQEWPVLHTPGITVLPHIGYATDEAFLNRLSIVVHNIATYMKDAEGTL
ncbi:MAG: NAD(P)-dependent oxidoreductase [Marinifilaceae bacterium]